ncbi:hypothetical protein ACRRTK_004308 [Alexandromys fortis]
MQVGALPRLCDVLRILQEERAQCVQELSKEKAGELGLETVSDAEEQGGRGRMVSEWQEWGEHLLLMVQSQTLRRDFCAERITETLSLVAR